MLAPLAVPGAAAIFAILVAVEPRAAGVAVAVPVVGWLLATPLRRAGVMIFGGIFTLGSPSLTTPKFLYLGAMATILVVALARGLSGRRHIPASLTWTTLAVVALVVVGAVNGLMAGNAVLDIVRDSSTYAGLASAGIVAADAAPWVNRRTHERVIVVAGLISTLGFTLEWLSRRGLAELPFTDVLLHSNVPGILLWSYSIARLASGGRRAWMWLASASISVGLPLLTGTRNVLLYAAAPVVVAGIAALRGNWRSASRTIIVGPVGLLLTTALVLGLQAGSTSQQLQTQAAIRRLATVGQTLDEPAVDPSLEERLTQTRVAWDTFTSDPLLGSGPGHIFRWKRSGPTSVTTEAYTIDTSLVTAAKYGMLGVAVLVTLLIAWHRARPRSEVWLSTIGGFVAVVSLLSVLGPTIEDKGLPLAVAIILMGRSCAVRPVDAQVVVRQRAPSRIRWRR